MLTKVGVAVALASIAAIAALAWTMILSPALVSAHSPHEARAYITVQIKSGNDLVSWYDPDECSSDYNIYLTVSTPVAGSAIPQITRTHLGTAASGSTTATMPISHGGGGGALKPTVTVVLFCGEFDGTSLANRVTRTALSVSVTSLRFGTFSSAPLTALSVTGATLSPSFNRAINANTTEVPGDERTITINAAGLREYQIDYIRNYFWNASWSCDAGRCIYSYGDGVETGIVLTDSEPNTAGFQIELEGGENRLGLGVHKGNEDARVGTYGLTVTVTNIAATGRPTVRGTTQVGQTLTAGTSAISDEDGLEDADFSYQWLRVNTDSTESEISGATGSSYTLVGADTGKSLKVRVTFTDGSGNSESLTSAATSTVTAAGALSADATLSALTLSDVNFGTFAAATTTYSARVNNSVSETTITPTLNHSGASYVIKIGSTEDTDGTVSLAVGSNAVTVEVTAADGQTTKTYTVAVTRLGADADPISSDASLSGLTLSGIDFGTFETNSTSYSASVANSVAQTTVTPTLNDSGASYAIKLNGVTDSDGTLSLRVGSNVIAVVVTAEDESTTQTYTVAVTRADPLSTDTTLKGLRVNNAEFGRYYAPGPDTYSLVFRNNVTEATVTPRVNHPGASYVILVDGEKDDDGVIPLEVGRNLSTIVVTAEDGVSTRTFNLSITRLQPPLTVSGSTTTNYAENGTGSVATYAATGAPSGATVTWSLSGDDSDDFSISSSGVLTFASSPNYESPSDSDTDNVYSVTVEASATDRTTGTLDVTVTVTDVNEGMMLSGG